MSDTAEFPLPVDATDEERATASREIGKHATIVEQTALALRLEGRTIGQTGPIWHFQYVRMFAVPNGFIAAGHDLREGIIVVFAKTAEGLAAGFGHESVRELVTDELTFRGAIAKRGSAHAG